MSILVVIGIEEILMIFARLANICYPKFFTEQENLRSEFQLQNYELDVLKRLEFQNSFTILSCPNYWRN